MKPNEAAETGCGDSKGKVKWGKAVGWGLAIGTVFGTVVGVATKNSMFIYAGMLFGGAVGAIVKFKQIRSD